MEHVIAKGPDVNFVVADLNNDGSMQVIATEFFSNKLSLLWQDECQWQTRVLDDSIGAAFDLSLVDLNNDGRLDLLVTNHEGADKGGGLCLWYSAGFQIVPAYDANKIFVFKLQR